MIYKLLTISIFISILFSCDCETKVTGKVIDKDTGHPISDAKVDLLNGADLAKTNGNGIFQVVKVTGFCKDPMIKVSSTGYKPFQVEIKKSKGSTQYIIKTELAWVDYNQPYYPDTNNRKTFINGIWINKWSQDFSIKDTLEIYLSKDSSIEEIKKNQTNRKTNR